MACQRCGLVAMLLLCVVAHGTALDLTEHPEGSAAKLTAEGNESLVQGDLAQAVKRYQQALAVDRRYFYALFNLALAYQELEDWDSARRYYEESLATRPDHPEVLCNLGIVAFHTGDYQEAVTRFTAAAEAVGGDTAAATDYLYNLGTAFERLEQWLDARRAYQRCLDAAEGQHFGARFNLGTLALGPLRQFQQAELHLQAAHQLEPNRPEPLLNLAVLAEERERYEVAREHLQAAVQAAAAHHPEQLPDLLWRRARFFDRLVPPRKLDLKRDLMELVRLAPDYPGANGLLGMYHESVGAYEQAITHLEREVSGDQFDPESEIDAESIYLLARIYSERESRLDRALEYATRYYRLRPDSPKLRELKRRLTRAGGGSEPAIDGSPR